MPFYQTKGSVPPKRHTVFKHNNKLCYEELVSRQGFSDIYTNLYHINMPTSVKQVGAFTKIDLKEFNLKHQAHHFETNKLNNWGDCINSRVPISFNNSVIISVAHVSDKMSYFYRNGHFDELLYVQYGKGVLSTNYGDLCYNKGDYIVIPRGVIWKLENDENTKLLVVESKDPIEAPNKYKNKFGQML